MNQATANTPLGRRHHIQKLSLVLDTMAGRKGDGDLNQESGLQQDTWLHCSASPMSVKATSVVIVTFFLFNCINTHKQISKAGG